MTEKTWIDNAGERDAHRKHLKALTRDSYDIDDFGDTARDALHILDAYEALLIERDAALARAHDAESFIALNRKTDESWAIVIRERDAALARAEKAEKFLDDYIGDFWTGCIDPQANFCGSCNHSRCMQCRLALWRTAADGGHKLAGQTVDLPEYEALDTKPEGEG